MQSSEAKIETRSNRRPTITDIARRANVSVWTVSHVLNSRSTASIAPGTRSRVMEIASEIGYRPNHAARALVNSKTQLIAIWMRTHVEYSTYYGRIQHSLQKIARRYGYHCIVEDVVLSEVEKQDFSNLMNWPMDGVIACDVSGPVEAYMQVNPNERLPIVNMGAFAVDSIDSIKLDLMPGTCAAAKHLIERGCKRIAYISRLPFDARAEAYTKVMQEGNRPIETIATPLDTRESACATVLDYVSKHGMPDGLLCENDDVAIGSFRAAVEMGASVPDDIAIVGCDGIEDTEYQVLPISTVKVPVDEMCEAAWKMLLYRIEHADAPITQSVIVPELVVRESSRKSDEVTRRDLR